MSAFCRKPVVCALFFSGLFCGCQSFRSLRHTDDFSVSHSTDLAEALANFGAGILREGQGDADAIYCFERTVELVPGNIRASFRLANQYVAHGQGDKALKVMEDACALNPTSVEACLLLAHVAQALKSEEKAEQALLRAVTIAPNQATIHLQLAAYYAGRRQEKMVLSTLENALPNVDDPLPLWRVLGDLYAAQVETADTSNAAKREVLQRAIECYEQAGGFVDDSMTPDYREKLADLYVINAQFDQAGTVYQDLIACEPSNLILRKKFALSLIAAGKRDDALQQLTAMTDMFSDDSDALVFTGELFERAGDVDSALKTFAAAIKVDPENTAASVKKALLLAPDDLDKALTIIQEASERVPSDIAVRDLLARLYLRARRGEEAASIFHSLRKQLEEKSPESITPEFWMGYAAASQQSAKPRQAVEYYRKALELNRHHLDAYVGLALLHLAQTNRAEALKVMGQAITTMPDDAKTMRMAGFVYSQAGDFKAACAAFERAGVVEARQSGGTSSLDANFFFHFGAACEREKKYAQAEKLLLRALELDPDYADAANYLAYMWAENDHNLQKALMLAEHAVELDPENGAYLDTLGWVYFKLGRLQEAEYEIGNALMILPNDPTIIEHYNKIMIDKTSEYP